MITAALAEVKSLVDKRFLLNAFFPCLAFTALALLLLAMGNGGVAHWIATWEGWSGTVQAVIAAAYITGVFVLAAFAISNQVQLTRLYEGWVGPEWLRAWSREGQQRRRDAASADVELTFPHGTVRPTALGNVLAAAEDYPGRAYGLDALVVWPRLYPLLPDAFLASVADALDTMQFLLLISFLAGVLAVAGGLYIAVVNLGAVTYLVVVLSGLAVCRLAYRSAVHAAIPYGLYLRAAFDLHRNALLTGLHRPIPVTPAEEKRVWREVADSLWMGETAAIRYVDETAEATAEGAKA